MTKFYDIELFHWAGMNTDNVDQLKIILDENDELYNATNNYGDNCLFIAAMEGNINIVKYLVQTKKINLNHQNKDNLGNLSDNVLMAALRKKQYEIVEYIIDHTSINLNTQNSKGETIFHLIAQNPVDEIVEKLIQKDIYKSIEIVNNEGQHCLFNLIQSYYLHKNFYSFDLIQEQLSNNCLKLKDKNNKDILSFALELNNKNLAPIINILKIRV